MKRFTEDPRQGHTGGKILPLILLLDTSRSMEGQPLNQMILGLKEFGSIAKNDPTARERMDICVITFSGEITNVLPFCSLQNYTIPHLAADGTTSMNQAIEAALDILEDRLAYYRAAGLQWFRPSLFLLTDGWATDPDRENTAVSRMHQYLTNKRLTYIPMAIGPHADRDALKRYFPPDTVNKYVLSASATNFHEFFCWGSNLGCNILHTAPGESVSLPPLPVSISI